MKVSHTLGGSGNGVPKEMEGDKRREVGEWSVGVLEKTKIFNFSRENSRVLFFLNLSQVGRRFSLSLSLSLWISLTRSLCLSIYLSFTLPLPLPLQVVDVIPSLPEVTMNL
jgi:hypothetical protein